MPNPDSGPTPPDLLFRPPAPPRGSRIALIAPAGPLGAEAIPRAAERVRAWGYEPVVGRHAAARHGFLAGTDAERLTDLQWALDDPEMAAVWCLRGGYGVMRIADRLRWQRILARPKPLIGFSDNTVLLLAAHRHGLVGLHGPHAAAAELPPFSEAGLRTALRPEAAGLLPFPDGHAERAETVIGGVAEGPLVGGNLSLLAATLGTPLAMQADGALLFMEEVGEPMYRVDRMLSQLLLSGALRNVVGVVVGAFSERPDTGQAHIPSLAELLRDRLGPLGIPVACGFPFGHIPESWTLPVGVPARLDADRGTLELLEPAVAPA